MSMSTCIVGFKPPDKKWKAMKAVWDACEQAKVDPPKVVEEFFNFYPPDDKGVEVEIQKDPCCEEWRAEGSEGFEIDVKKLPQDVTVIRFYNSW